MQNPRVSIIACCYNIDKYVSECIESLIKQTYRNIEIIIVDDGSTDSTPIICDSFKEQNDNIFVIHKQNGGLSAARLSGYKQAAGEYVCFVDGDDCINPDYVEVLVSLANSSNADMVGCRFYRNDIFSNEMIIPKPDNTYNFETDGRGFLIRLYNNAYLGTCWGKLAKRSVYTEEYFSYSRVHEDNYGILYLANNCKKIIFIDKPLYFYRQNPAGIMGTKSINDYGIQCDMDWKIHHINYYQTIGDSQLEFEARKLLCHDIFAKRKYMSKKFKNDIRSTYTKEWKRVVSSQYTTFKSRVKYLIFANPLCL